MSTQPVLFTRAAVVMEQIPQDPRGKFSKPTGAENIKPLHRGASEKRLGEVKKF